MSQRVVVAAGFNGHGIQLAGGIATLVAKAIGTPTFGVDLFPTEFSPGRFEGQGSEQLHARCLSVASACIRPSELSELQLRTCSKL